MLRLQQGAQNGTVDCRAVSLVIKSGDVLQDFFFLLSCLNKQVYWLKTIVRNATHD